MSTAAAPQQRFSFAQRVLVTAVVVAAALGLDAAIGGFGDEPGTRLLTGLVAGAAIAVWGLHQREPGEQRGTGRVFDGLLLVAILVAAALLDGTGVFLAGFALAVVAYEAGRRLLRR